MEARDLAASSGGGRNSAVRNDEEDSAEMHEDADFSDLPVHFQPIEVDGRAHSGPPATTPISDLLGEKTQRGLMDADSQYLDAGLTPNYTSPPPITYASSSSSTYTSPPPPSSYTSPPPLSNTMDIAYNPMNRPAVYPPPTLGSHGDAMGNTLAYGGSSYHGNAHCSSMNNNAGMYTSPGIHTHFEAAGETTTTAVAETSGKSTQHHQSVGVDTYQSGGVQGVVAAGGVDSELELYGRSGGRLCSAGVNTVESGGCGLNAQVSTERSAAGGQGGGEQQAPKPFQCPECQASFTRVDHLNRHLKTQSSHFRTVDDKQYHPCPHCQKLFTRRDHMKRHIKIHIRGEPVKCVECQTWYPSKMDLTHHLLDAHSVLVFECNACSKGFFEAKYLTEHLRHRHDMVDGPDGRLMRAANSKLPHSHQVLQLPYRCGICSLSFVNELACNKHMMSHSKRLTGPASSLSLASSHLTEVRDVAAMSHLWAQAALASDSNMQAFRGQHSPHKANPYLGNGMAMSAFPQNQPHGPSQSVKSEPGDIANSSHQANGRFNPLVNGAFPQSHPALRTMQCAGSDSFLCGVCGKGFLRVQELKTHMRKHSGHHRFVCIECGACFASASNLVRHKRTHSGERPFKCSLCSSAFTHKGALINHERIHTGEKPYVCDLCEAAFARVDALTRHKRTHKENRIKQEDEESTDDIFGLQP
ncbi:uncharacterized protein LOC143300507 isoform X2 [Babylonia areolata]|uniref:uncharacterized protein LOC143300507 isoform X2 n=1 Tax=Babylonia areolata TaxID=304850 RepID=UPI003FD01FD0